MNNNVFQFDNTYWLQTCGTSKGTSCACTYATLYWAYIEHKYIIPKWNHQLHFIRWFIDDKFGVWTGSKEEFEDFKQDLNSYCQLQWTSDGLKTTVTFLDLTSIIDDKYHVTTKTFQKSTNLHLYIPPASAHPPGVLKNLIYGNLHRYWKQNTNVADYIEIAKQFAKHLIAHGYKKENIQNIFLKAAQKFDKIIKKKANRDSNTLYLHWEYHPRDISKSKLRQLFKETLQTCSDFNNLIICYSRTKNLRGSLMKRKLCEPEGMRISNLLQNNGHGIRRGT